MFLRLFVALVFLALTIARPVSVESVRSLEISITLNICDRTADTGSASADFPFLAVLEYRTDPPPVLERTFPAPPVYHERILWKRNERPPESGLAYSRT